MSSSRTRFVSPVSVLTIKIMKVLIAGDDPQVLTLAYYILAINPEAEVTIGYTREERTFRDDVLNIEPVHRERLVTSLGAEILPLRDIDKENYDVLVDVMSYRVEGGQGDAVLVSGGLDTLIASRRGLRMLFLRDSDLIDSDVLKYVRSRHGDLVCIVESERDYANMDVTKVVYGVKHIEDERCVYVGYGYRYRFEGVDLEVTDPAYVYKQCVLAGIVIAHNLPLDSIRRAPYWYALQIRDTWCLIAGPTSRQIAKTRRNVTSVPLTVDECYLKVLCLYKQGIIGYQVVGPRDDVRSKAALLYSLITSGGDYYSLSKLIFVPSVPSTDLRTWVDVLLESSVKEMYWIFYA